VKFFRVQFTLCNIYITASYSTPIDVVNAKRRFWISCWV